MTTGPINPKPTDNKSRSHEVSYNQNRKTATGVSPISLKEPLFKVLAGTKARPAIIPGRTSLNLASPRNPSKSMVSLPNRKNPPIRADRFINQKVTIDHTGDPARKLKVRLKTVTQSQSSIKGTCNPFYRLRRHLNKVKVSNKRVLQKISNLLVGGLVLTRHPVGISLSKNIRMVVTPPSTFVVKQIVSCLPHWATSYTMNEVLRIVSLLKKGR